MSKLKKLLIVPIVYHVAILGVLLYMSMNYDPKLNVVAPLILDWMLGAIVTPMFFAVISIIHAIVHEGKVYDYIYNCLAYLGIIGLLRCAVYFFIDGITGATLGAAGAILAVSVGVYVLWAALFTLTDHMMKKRPKKRVSQKSNKKK